MVPVGACVPVGNGELDRLNHSLEYRYIDGLKFAHVDGLKYANVDGYGCDARLCFRLRKSRSRQREDRSYGSR